MDVPKSDHSNTSALDHSTAPHFRLIVGLGNPGREYARTRHNVGFMVLDRIAGKAGVEFRAEKRWRAEVGSHGGVVFCKPASYMNLSGQPVAAVSHFYKIPPAEILVVLDDAALPLGKLRLRATGSSGGHNGLQSIIEHLGTPDVPRLRIGIGASAGPGLTDHVLGRFAPDELPALDQCLACAVEAIEFAQKNDAEATMNLYNR
jgi:peptidyl-tRNA hydrolase, PTH1 family